MKILITAATTKEVSPLLQSLGHSENEASFYAINKNPQLQIDVLITGIGLMHTAFHLGRHLNEHKDYDLAINMGICGCYDRTIPIGGLLNITSDQEAWYGSSDNGRFISIYDLNLMDKDDFPYRNGELLNDTNTFAELISGLSTVKAITVHKSSGTEAETEEAIQLYNPIAESMEGSAFAYACIQNSLPFYQIRSVSNYVGPRQTGNWNVPFAINNLNTHIIHFLNSKYE